MELRVTSNNTWRTMILTRCPGDRAVAVRALAAARNAVAGNATYTQRQRLPSIRATMRSVRRRG